MFDLIEIEKALGETAPASRSPGCMFCEVSNHLVVAATENFYLIRDLFPIVDGHLMIISKDHYGCMGELPHNQFVQVEELRNEAAQLFAGRPFIGYEHGRAGHCVKLKGTEITCHHFHLHYVPLALDIRPAIEPAFTAQRTSGLASARNFYERFGEYLYFENTAREGFFYPANNSVAPHLLRTLVCEAAGLSERSDWETL